MLADDTILVFTSDNGWQLNDHKSAGNNLDLRDESQDVATKAKTLARTTFGSETDAMISLADTLATSAGLLGWKLPDSAGPDSFGLSPVMLGKTVDPPIRTTVISQTSRGLLAYRNGDWKLRFSKAPSWSKKKAVTLNGTCELYNLAKDSGERKNLASKDPERVTAMTAELLELLKKGRSK